MRGGNGVTSGGGGSRRFAPYAVAAGLLVVAVGGNLASTADHLARSGRPVALLGPLVDELASAVAWFAVLPAIAWAFARISPPRVRWLAVVPFHVAFIPLISLTHFVLARAFRAVVSALQGNGFGFFFAWGAYAADLYKDVLTYLLFGFIYRGVERLMAPLVAVAAAADDAGPDPAPAPVIEVRDGPHTLYLSAAEILWIEAAGNYVELHASGGRNILMRTTLASLAGRLEGAGFLRVHRSRLVNTAAIGAVENLPTGDFTLLLSDGAKIAASRRYRAGLGDALAARLKGEARWSGTMG